MMNENNARIVITSESAAALHPVVIEGAPQENRVISVSSSGHTISHRAITEIRIEPDKRPAFANIGSDYNLLEQLHRYARFCEQYNVQIPQMAQSLARAIGIQNQGRCNVIIHDYLQAIPEYPPTQNGKKEVLSGEGYWGNIVCYKNNLFGVCVFPATQHVTFYFPEFASFTPHVQQLIFTYGNKELRLCRERNALAFDFKPIPPVQEAAASSTTQTQPILLTATLKRKLSAELSGSQQPLPKKKNEGATETTNIQQQRDNRDYIQLD